MQRAIDDDNDIPVRPSDPMLRRLLIRHGLIFGEIQPAESDYEPILDCRDIDCAEDQRSTLLGLLALLENRNIGLAETGREEQICLCVAVPRTMLSTPCRKDTKRLGQTVFTVGDQIFRYQHVWVVGGGAARTFLDLGHGEVLAEIECRRLQAAVDLRFRRERRNAGARQLN